MHFRALTTFTVFSVAITSIKLKYVLIVPKGDPISIKQYPQCLLSPAACNYKSAVCLYRFLYPRYFMSMESYNMSLT